MNPTKVGAPTTSTASYPPPTYHEFLEYDLHNTRRQSPHERATWTHSPYGASGIDTNAMARASPRSYRQTPTHEQSLRPWDTSHGANGTDGGWGVERHMGWPAHGMEPSELIPTGAWPSTFSPGFPSFGPYDGAYGAPWPPHQGIDTFGLHGCDQSNLPSDGHAISVRPGAFPQGDSHTCQSRYAYTSCP